jgi:hypothetical protein
LRFCEQNVTFRSRSSSQSIENFIRSSQHTGSVYVYTYPQGQLVGTLANLNTIATGECADSVGDVFITTSSPALTSKIFEYAHGATSPIATLNDPGVASGCAIDPETGNLAVANSFDTSNPYRHDYGDVAIYAEAQGRPTMYYGSQFGGFWFCGYDDKANLYLSAFDEYTGTQLVRLASGSNVFDVITLNMPLYGDTFKPSVQWDGKHLTVSSSRAPQEEAVSVYRLSITGSSATVIGTTSLGNRGQHHTGQSWIQGGTIIGIDYKGFRDVSLWHYPAGGRPVHTIRKMGDLKNEGLYGLTVPWRRRTKVCTTPAPSAPLHGFAIARPFRVTGLAASIRRGAPRRDCGRAGASLLRWNGGRRLEHYWSAGRYWTGERRE